MLRSLCSRGGLLVARWVLVVPDGREEDIFEVLVHDAQARRLRALDRACDAVSAAGHVHAQKPALPGDSAYVRVGIETADRRHGAIERRFDDLLVRAQLLDVALQHRFTVMHDSDMVGGTLYLADLMRGEEDGRATGGRVDHEIQDVALVHRVEPSRRLVEHERLGPDGKREGQRKRALLTLRQLLDTLACIEAEKLDQMLRDGRIVRAKGAPGEL